MKIRSLALILALLTLLTMIASCAETSETEQTTEASTVTPSESDIPEGESTAISCSVPDMNYGETVTILYWKDVPRLEFDVVQSEMTGEIVEQAIFSRNAHTASKLGIEFEWIGVDGNNNNRAAFTNHVDTAYKGGTKYDMIATYSRTAGMLTTRGLLDDFNQTENSYLDLDKPWWPERMTETCTIGDSLYFISGDISTTVLHLMYGIYYNIDLLNNLKLDDPVKFVDDYTWTIEKLIEMSSNLYQDNNGDGKQDDDDSYGFTTIYYNIDALYTGSELRLVESDPDKLLVISEDYTSQKSVDLVDTLGEWLTDDTCYISRKGDKCNYREPFLHGSALFCLNRVYMADPYYEDNGLYTVDWTYGILPAPLYNEDQKEYITTLGNPFTLWCLMRDTENPSMCTAVIETMAYEAYNLTTPALFETNMKFRYTTVDSPDAVRMFDIIREGIDFDLGRIFTADLMTMSEIPSQTATTGGSWASVSRAKSVALNKKIAELVSALEEISD